MRATELLRRQLYLAGKQAMGSQLGPCLGWLRANQFLTAPENRQLQDYLLTGVLSRAYRDIPFYRERLLRAGVADAEGQISLAAFHELPPLTREELRLYGPQLMHPDAQSSPRLRPMPSGGTTGDPVVPYGDQNSWDWSLAQTMLYYEWTGLRLGMPYFYFWGAPGDIQASMPSMAHKVWLERFQNRKVLNCRLMSPEVMADLVSHMNHHRQYQHMVAYISELYDLACFIRDENLPLTRTFQGMLVTTAELTEPMREVMESVFGGPVYSRYGCREAGDLACECAYQRGHHINPLYAKVEVVDDLGRPLPPGEEGRLWVTPLHNSVMPLIRYEIQDLGILSPPERCACGRDWDTLARITGRLHEKIHLPDGATLGKVFLHYPMEVLPELQRYQFVQQGPRHLEILLVSPLVDYPARYPQEIAESRRRLMDLTRGQLTLTYRQVPAVVPSPSGKTLLILHQSVPDPVA